MGGPGIALIMLRAAVVASLWARAIRSPDSPNGASLVACVVLIALSGLIALGLLTPIAAGLSVFLNIDFHSIDAIAAAMTAGALALLGPGGHSIDAWMFGRRVVVVGIGSPPTGPTAKE